VYHKWCRGCFTLLNDLPASSNNIFISRCHIDHRLFQNVKYRYVLPLPTFYSSCILLCSPPRHVEAQSTEGGRGYLKVVSVIHIWNEESFGKQTVVLPHIRGSDTKFKGENFEVTFLPFATCLLKLLLNISRNSVNRISKLSPKLSHCNVHILLHTKKCTVHSRSQLATTSTHPGTLPQRIS